MSEQNNKLNEKEFLASLGLDDIDLTVDEQPKRKVFDAVSMIETLDTLSLLRQIGAMVNSKAPVLEPPPEGSSDKPPIVAELLDLLNFSEKNQKNTKEV